MRRTGDHCMSKTALDRMSKGFALELTEYGIRVNCWSGFAKGSSVSHLSEEHVEQVLSSIPLGGEISKMTSARPCILLQARSQYYRDNSVGR